MLRRFRKDFTIVLLQELISDRNAKNPKFMRFLGRMGLVFENVKTNLLIDLLTFVQSKCCWRNLIVIPFNENIFLI